MSEPTTIKCADCEGTGCSWARNDQVNMLVATICPRCEGYGTIETTENDEEAE